MNRISTENPAVGGYLIQSLQFSMGVDLELWEKTLPKVIPHGFRPFFRWTDGASISVGIEPIPEKEVGSVKVGEDLAIKTIPELQTMCAMASIKYEKTDTQAVLVGKLAKRVVK